MTRNLCIDLTLLSRSQLGNETKLWLNQSVPIHVLPKMDPRRQSTFLFPLLKIRCPHCSSESVFGLASKHYRRFGLALGKTYFLQCTGCGFERNVRSGKAEAWQKLRRAYQGLDTGELSDGQFETILEAIDEPDLTEFLEEAGIWKCNCGEENPSNFAVCWSCGSEATGPVRNSTDGSLDTGGGHPWES